MVCGKRPGGAGEAVTQHGDDGQHFPGLAIGRRSVRHLRR
jgi:hypothetical protein